jgi:hypothetical protein
MKFKCDNFLVSFIIVFIVFSIFYYIINRQRDSFKYKKLRKIGQKLFNMIKKKKKDVITPTENESKYKSRLYLDARRQNRAEGQVEDGY